MRFADFEHPLVVKLEKCRTSRQYLLSTGTLSLHLCITSITILNPSRRQFTDTFVFTLALLFGDASVCRHCIFLVRPLLLFIKQKRKKQAFYPYFDYNDLAPVNGRVYIQIVRSELQVASLGTYYCNLLEQRSSTFHSF